MSKNSKQTSHDIASLASDVLRDPTASKEEKSLAASVLAQSSNQKETGKEVEKLASRMLKDAHADSVAKRLAASALAQAHKKD